MPFKLWDGTDLIDGSVFRWDGEALQPGRVRQYPWFTIDPPPPPDPDVFSYPLDTPTGKARFGVATTLNSAGLVSKWETPTSEPLAMVRRAFSWTNRADAITEVDANHLLGRANHISIKCPDYAGSYYDVITDVYQTEIETFLTDLKDTNVNCWLSINHEPEDEPTYGTATDWRAVQRYFEAVRQAVGADNVLIVPVLKASTFATGSGLNPNDWVLPEADFPLYGVDYFTDSFTTSPLGFNDPVENAFMQKLTVENGKDVCIPECGGAIGTSTVRPANLWNAFVEEALLHGWKSVCWADTGTNESDAVGPDPTGALYTAIMNTFADSDRNYWLGLTGNGVPVVPLSELDGGTPLTLSFTNLVDGGTPETVIITNDDLVAAMASPAYAGHRFGRNNWNENTFFAASNYFGQFTSDIQDLGECDLHVLSDGTTLVLNHDATVSFGGSTVAISSLTPAQWDTLTLPGPTTGAAQQPAAFWDHPSYPAKSVAKLWGNKRIFVPELKTTAARVPLTNWINANNAEGSVIVQYAVYNTAAYTANIIPMITAGLYTMPVVYTLPGTGGIPSLATMATDGVYGIMISTTFLAANPTIIASAHALGLKVFTFNSNSSANVQAQVALGVDCVLSDNPVTSFPTSGPSSPSTGTYDGGTP
jgi:glycerophosphoryl diester phosphodiesterase